MKANVSGANGIYAVDVIEFFEIDGRKFFIHQYVGDFEEFENESTVMYKATEWRSGFCVSWGMFSAEEAKRAVINIFKRVGAERFDSKVEAAIRQYGQANV